MYIYTYGLSSSLLPTRPAMGGDCLLLPLPYHSLPRAGIPNYMEGVITPSPGHPETSASPTWASAAVTGTFHNRHTVFMNLRRTFPDSADFPPGLYASNMVPFPQEPQLPDNPTLNALLASYGNMYTTMCQIRTTNTINSN